MKLLLGAETRARYTALGCMGALLNYLDHRQLSFDEKDESYLGVIARDFGGFHPRTQLNDALNESYAKRKCVNFSCPQSRSGLGFAQF